jgi:hypothetical protein
MKLIQLLPPVAALVIVATALGLQRGNLATLDESNSLLRQQLANARSGEPSPQTTASGKLTPGQGPLAWKKLARQLVDMQQGNEMDQLRAGLRLQQRIQEMTREQLIAALDDIAALDVSAESRAMLERLLIGPLIEKDPELALARFSDRLQDNRGGITWQLASALQAWAKQDIAKASAWFDAQIAAGKFDSKALDGRSQSRIQFEQALMGVLLTSDPAAAGQRLAALPADQRADVMRQLAGMNSLNEQDQLAFAKLVRAQLPATQQAGIISQVTPRLANGGYAKVSEYLTRIEATPAERSAAVEQAAGSLIRFPNDKPITRETDHITGAALGQATQGGNQKLEFAAAAELAVQYSQASGTDEVLGTFLESWPAHEHKEQARVLATRITDEKRRADILRNLQ